MVSTWLDCASKDNATGWLCVECCRARLGWRGSRLCMLAKMAVWVVQLDVGMEKTRGAEEGEKERMEERKERLTARAGCLL